MDQNREIECIRQVLQGHSDRFAELVSTYQARAYHLCYHMLGNKEDARDCTQEAFIKAFEALGSFRLDSRFSTWFYRIVYHTCISNIRKRDRWKPLNQEDLQASNPQIFNAGPDSLNMDDTRRLLQAARSTLTPEETFLIDQFYREEASVEELSLMTGLSRSNVKVRLFRARQKMLRTLQSVLKEEIELWQMN
ncbi:MAG: sigma-70 family RNA polymerase sigma factor [Bacteroidales bacterium]